jgi:hypothetical protein
MALILENPPRWNAQTRYGFGMRYLLLYKQRGKVTWNKVDGKNNKSMRPLMYNKREKLSWDEVSEELKIPKRTLMNWLRGTKISRGYLWLLITTLPTITDFIGDDGLFCPPKHVLEQSSMLLKKHKQRLLKKRRQDN